MARFARRAGRGARQWRRRSQAGAKCARLDGWSARGAPRPDRKGRACPRKARGRPIARLPKGASQAPWRPPGAPFPSLLGGIPQTPWGKRKKGREACPAPSKNRGDDACLPVIPKPHGSRRAAALLTMRGEIGVIPATPADRDRRPSYRSASDSAAAAGARAGRARLPPPSAPPPFP